MIRRRRSQCNETPTKSIETAKDVVPKSSFGRMLTNIFSSRTRCQDEDETRSPSSDGEETINTPKEKSHNKEKKNHHQHKIKIIDAPQKFLENRLNTLGQKFETIETLKNNQKEPTSLQLSSFHPYVVELVENENIDKLRELFDAGLSSNACNPYGETIAHKVCRKGCSPQVLQVLVEYGCSVDLPDNFGRTTLHDLCARPVMPGLFETIDIVLGNGMTKFNMFYMADCRGSLPLDNVAQKDWKCWAKYIEKKLKEQLVLGRNHDEIDLSASLQANGPESKLRKISITPEVADLLASGKIKPAHVKLLTYEYIHFDDEEMERNDECDDEDSFSTESFDDDCEPLPSTNPQYEALMSQDAAFKCGDFDNFDDDNTNDDASCYSMDAAELLDILESTSIVPVSHNDQSFTSYQLFCMPSMTKSC